MLIDTSDTTFQTLNKQVIYLACAYFFIEQVHDINEAQMK